MNERPKVERICSECGDVRMVDTATLRRMTFPLLCKRCSTRRHGITLKYRAEESPTYTAGFGGRNFIAK